MDGREDGMVWRVGGVDEGETPARSCWSGDVRHLPPTPQGRSQRSEAPFPIFLSLSDSIGAQRPGDLLERGMD